MSGGGLSPARLDRMHRVLEGYVGFVGNAIGLFLDVDYMIGSDFERGLESLRLAVE